MTPPLPRALALLFAAFTATASAQSPSRSPELRTVGTPGPRLLYFSGARATDFPVERQNARPDLMPDALLVAVKLAYVYESGSFQERLVITAIRHPERFDPRDPAEDRDSSMRPVAVHQFALADLDDSDFHPGLTGGKDILDSGRYHLTISGDRISLGRADGKGPTLDVRLPELRALRAKRIEEATTIEIAGGNYAKVFPEGSYKSIWLCFAAAQDGKVLSDRPGLLDPATSACR